MSASAADLNEVRNYIRATWPKTIRENKELVDRVKPLPYPYSVPCSEGFFRAFFYWDTYFTNLGLLRDNLEAQARFNCQNIAYLVQTHGFMPNDTWVDDDNRSQPPYFSLMVRDCYDFRPDKNWLRELLPQIRKEYDFWMTRRITPIGLNRHFHTEPSQEKLIATCHSCRSRCKLPPLPNASPAELAAIGANFLAEAETGWDFTPRFDRRCADFAPVDLNSNLYVYETNFAFFSRELGLGEEQHWEELAAKRKALMMQHLWNNARGLFMDYDTVNHRTSSVASLAAFHPLWLGIATPAQAQATQKNLPLFEYPYGVCVCEKSDCEIKYQWDYPNLWPCMVYTTATGLRRYGFADDAQRIAQKYLDLQVFHFKKTGKLWEKYNVVDGSIAGEEYHAPELMDWTAGVFNVFMDA